MTTPTPEVQGPEVTTPPVTDAPLASEPAASPWAEYLTPLPESVRPLVEPIFKTWDADVTKKFQSLHSEYDPYKSLIDEYEPDALMQAIAVVNSMQEDPTEFIKQVMAAYELQPEQGTANAPVVPDTGEVTPDPLDDRFGKMEEMLGMLAQTIIGDREQVQQSQQEVQLDSILTDLKTEHGEFDELYVLTLMSQGMSPEDSVNQFKSTVNGFATKLNAPSSGAPNVVSSNGGGYPTEPIKPGDLSDKGTKDLIVQMLAAAAAANNG